MDESCSDSVLAIHNRQHQQCRWLRDIYVRKLRATAGEALSPLSAPSHQATSNQQSTAYTDTPLAANTSLRLRRRITTPTTTSTTNSTYGSTLACAAPESITTIW